MPTNARRRADVPSGNTESASIRRRIYGQNFFKSAADAESFADQLQAPPGAGRVVEIGPGSGRITAALARRGYPVIAVEIDQSWQRRVAAKNLPGTEVTHADFLTWKPPRTPIVAIGNLPFGSGTAILRRCLGLGPERLREAVFLMQQEFVWKRVGRYGGNLFNAQWWPWYEFREGLRFSRYAFQPAPRTDTATLIVTPLGEPGLPWAERDPYQDLVSAVFNTGHVQIGTALRTVAGRSHASWLHRAGIRPHFPVKQLKPRDWATLYLKR